MRQHSEAFIHGGKCAAKSAAHDCNTLHYESAQLAVMMYLPIAKTHVFVILV